MVHRLVVTADDTTGALETAAACADLGWVATVAPYATSDVERPGPRDGATDRAGDRVLRVVDLRSRHVPADDAAARTRGALAAGPALRAHKIDSTLRGNWAAELAAIADTGRQVLLVPAFPAAGRTCVAGTVLVDGVPVDRTVFAQDPRSPVRWSRPADRLPSAVEAADADAARRALDRGARSVVADATTDAQVAELVAVAVGRAGLVVAGPAAVVTAFVRLWGEGEGVAAAGTVHDPATPRAAPLDPAGVLVVSASQHPAAVAQCTSVVAHGITVLRPPADARIEDADAVLDALGRAVRDHLVGHPEVATVLLIGGDTAAAVLGDACVDVDGSLGVGIAVGTTELVGRRMRVVAKPGGFGGPDTLVDLLAGAVVR